MNHPIRRLAAGLLVLIAFAGMPAQAQAAPLAVALSDLGPALAPDSETALEATLTLDCKELITSGGSLRIEGQATPDHLEVTGEAVDVTVTDCPLGKTSLQKTMTAMIRPRPDAPAAVPTDLVISASFIPTQGQPKTAAATKEDLVVSYRPGHRLDPHNRTFGVDGTDLPFTLTVDVFANAPTMVMFEDKEFEGGGSISGLRPIVVDPINGSRTRDVELVFTAPSGPWDKVVFTFRSYSHCLRDGCTEQNQTRVAWTFVSATPATDRAPTMGNGTAPAPPPAKESSTLPTSLLLLLIVVVAIMRRRRSVITSTDVDP